MAVRRCGLRIAVDGRCVQDHFPGIGRYTYNLCRALSRVGSDHSFVILYNPADYNTRFPLAALAELPNVEVKPIGVNVFSIRSQLVFPSVLKRERVDVFHSPYYVRPYCTFTPTVVTLHDVTPVLFPEYQPSLWSRLAYKMATRLTVATATKMITGSKAAGQDFCRLFGVPWEKLRVVYHGTDDRYRPQPEEVACRARRHYDLWGEFFLYVGINKPHKNLARLVEAFSQLEDHRVSLVIAGPEDLRYGEVREAALRCGVAERVRLPGPIGEDALPALYSAATAFVFPSYYEGFGLPVLEAMACGTPVISSNASSLPEVVGDAGILVDPNDTKAWVEAMRRVLSGPSLRARLRADGLARAAEFSWDRAARETLEVYAEVAKG